MTTPDHAQRLRSLRTGIAVIFTKYSQRRERVPETLFCFFEALIDQSAYLSHLKSMLTKAKLFPIQCDGKKGVLAIFGRLVGLDAAFANALFFVDRDYDDVLDAQAPSDWRVFVTNGYSIESEYICSESMTILLQDICAIGEDEEEIRKRVDVYIAAREAFGKALVPVLAVGIFFRARNSEVNFGNAKLQKLVQLLPGQPPIRIKHALSSFLTQTLQKGPAAPLWKSRRYIKELRSLPYEKAMWGKYALEFMRLYFDTLVDEFKANSVKHVAVSANGTTLVQLISGRKAPTGLTSFIEAARPRLSVPT